jgi:hypothetical protein
MSEQYRSETPRAAMNRFLHHLTRSTHLLTADIELEEARTGVRDLKNPAYSTLARNLRARRDNLVATIAMLEASAPAKAA